jgi:HKD family nuclease
MVPANLINNAERNLAEQVLSRLQGAKWAFFIVAFIRKSGVDVLDDGIQDFIKRNGELLILAEYKLGITQASAVQRLKALGAKVKIYTGKETFHPKCYLFGSGSFDLTSAIVGSSNVTSSGLISGIEWNLLVEKSDDWDLRHICDAARALWSALESEVLSPKLLDEIRGRERNPQHDKIVRDEDRAPSSAKGISPKVPLIAHSFEHTIGKTSRSKGVITIKNKATFEKLFGKLTVGDAAVSGPGLHECRARIAPDMNHPEMKGGYRYYQIHLRPAGYLSELPLGKLVRVYILHEPDGVKVRLSDVPGEG